MYRRRKLVALEDAIQPSNTNHPWPCGHQDRTGYTRRCTGMLKGTGGAQEAARQGVRTSESRTCSQLHQPSRAPTPHLAATPHFPGSCAVASETCEERKKEVNNSMRGHHTNSKLRFSKLFDRAVVSLRPCSPSQGATYWQLLVRRTSLAS